MGVGTDSMMPPKIGFVKLDSELHQHEESHTYRKYPLQKLIKKDPGMNAEELNRFPTQKYVETSSESISSPFLVTRQGLLNHHDQSLFLSPFLVQNSDEKSIVGNISQKPAVDNSEEIFIPSDFYPLGKPYDETVMKEIIRKMAAQNLIISDTAVDDKYDKGLEISLQKPPLVSRPFIISNSRFQTSFGEDKYR